MTEDASTWVRHEAGWYTLRGVGGICNEHDGWAFWPLHGDPVRGLKSLEEAKKVAIYGRDLRNYSRETQ